MGAGSAQIAGTIIQNGAQTNSSIIQALIGYGAAKKARRELQKSIGQATGTVTQYGKEAEGFQQPYYDQGTAQWTRLNDLSNQGYFDPQTYTETEQQPDYGTFTPEQFNFQQDPGYQFRQQQGQAAIEGGAASRGLQLSGATQKALARYSGNLASSEYGNAYSRYMANRQQSQNEFQDTRNFLRNKYTTDRGFRWNQFLNAQQQRGDQFNQLAGMASTGQAAGNNLATLRHQTGSDIANLQLGLGNVNAGYQMTIGNLGTKTAENIGNAQAKTGSDISGMGGMGGMGGGGGGSGAIQQNNAPSAYGQSQNYGQNYQQQNGVDLNYHYQPNSGSPYA